MASTGLPPPPINDAPGSFTWLEWYRQLRSYISTSGSVPWYVIDFAGSNITDIAQRDHNQLQNLQGGTAGEKYHLTAAQHAALGSGDHNDLSNIQGGTATQRYHLTQTEYEWVQAGGGGGGSYLPTTGGTMTGPINFLGAQLETATIAMVPDPLTPGSDVLEVDSDDGIRLKAPYIVIDTDNPILTMPGPQVGSLVVVAGVDGNGDALLGYQAPVEPGYTVQDTHDANVVIKVAGSVPPTAWVLLQLGFILTGDIPAGTGTAAFEMILSNPTNRTGVVEFGLRVNGVDLNRDITQSIPANFQSTIAFSLPLTTGYVAGDNIQLIARVTSNSNNGFALTMIASPTDLAVFRMSSSTGGGTSIYPSDNLPLMDGVAAAGTSDLYTRGDHVHPSDTTKAPATHVGATGIAHGVVTTSVNGFMIAADKTKLDGIATGANNYSLPIASTTILGGIKIGTGLTIDGSGVTTATTNLGNIPSAVDIVVTTSNGNPTTLPAPTATLAGVMTAAAKVKLDGIATGATANVGTVTNIATSGAISGGPITSTGTISHLTTDGNLHVPATGTTNSGKVLTAGATAGSLSWQTPATGGGTAASVSFVPSGTIVATNVQAAIEELNAELELLRSQLYAYG